MTTRPIIIFVCLFLVVVLAFVLVLPEYQEFSFFQKQLSQKETELEYKEDYFMELEEISDKLQEYSEEIDKLDSALPSDDIYLPDLLMFLQEAGEESGLILTDIGEVSSRFFYDATEREVLGARRGLREHSFDISFYGRYPAFTNFLSTVFEKTSRFLKAEIVSFSHEVRTEEERAAAAAGQYFFSFDLQVKFYSY